MTTIKVLKGITLASLLLGLTPIVIAQTASQKQNNSAQTDPIAVDNDRLDRALETFEADQYLQRTRPVAEPEPVEMPETRERQGPNPFWQAIANFFEAIGSVLGYLLAAIIGVAILAALYMMLGERLTLRRREKDVSVSPDISESNAIRPEQARATALLQDADALAAQGRFAEAVHLLLFRSIDDLQAKQSGAIGRALTAREIGALSGLPETVRNALKPIIQIVERSFFGGRDVTKAGWEEARSSYQVFAFGEVWS